MLRRRTALIAGAALLAAPRLGRAQGSYPARPVRVVNAYSPGGTADVVCRILFTRLSERTGTQFAVDNRPGAAGTVAAGTVAHAAADGYTLLYDATAHSVNPALFGTRLPYDTRRDFLPVFLAMLTPNTVVATKGFPGRGLADLIAAAKRAPGALDAGTTGIGTAQHLLLERINRAADIRINHVVYRDFGALKNDVLAGRVPFELSNVPGTVEFVQTGSATVLAHSGLDAVPMLPGVPPIVATLPGLESYEWNGVFAPAGTSGEVVRWLSDGLNATIAEPRVAERLQTLGAGVRRNSPDDFAAFVDSQITANAAVVRDANIRID